MKDALDATPGIIASAAQSPLGILALTIIVLSVLAYLFFGGASERVRVGAFTLLLVGAAGLGYAILRAHQPAPLPAADAAPAPAPKPVAPTPPAPAPKAVTGTPPLPPKPVTIELPVEREGDAVRVAAKQILAGDAPPPGTVTFRFVKQTVKNPVDVEIQRARNGAKITTSGHIQANGEWRSQTRALRDLAGERLRVFRWAPGLLNQMGSGGGAAYVTLPKTGDVEIAVTVTN
jgi:hypothetical protein